MASEHAEYARRTERIKNLLSSYYGSAEGNQPGTPGSRDTGALEDPNKPKQLPTTLDSVAFNADRHISQMIKTYPLDKLLSEHRGMAREIKNLDSDMQQLVYENYNKFITATDTIRTLKVNVDGMESSMDQLKTIMDDVAGKSSAVNLKLQRRRQHMEELSRVHVLMTKLQAVIGLPRRMRAALEEGALDSGVAFYAEALPLLKKYGERGALRGVAAEAELVAGDMARQLKGALAERKGETEQVVLLLRKLGEGDDSLQDKYLQGRAARMHKILAEAAAVVDWMQATHTTSSSRSSPLPLPAVEAPEELGCGEAALAGQLRVLLAALGERLVAALGETAANVAGIFLQDEKAAGRRKPLVGVCRGVVEEYFRVVRRAVEVASQAAAAAAAQCCAASTEPSLQPGSPSTALGKDWGAEVVLEAAGQVAGDVGQLAGALPELSLVEWGEAAGRQLVTSHLMAMTGALAGRVTGALRMLGNQLGEVADAKGEQAALQLLQPAYAHLVEVLGNGLPALMQGLKPYEGQHKVLSPWRDELSDGVQGALQGLFLGLGAEFLATARIRADVMTNGQQTGSAASSYSGSGPPPGTNPSSSRDSSKPQPPSTSTPSSTPSSSSCAEGPRSGLVLLLAKLAQHMEGVCVPAVLDLLGASSWSRAGRARLGDEPPVFMAGEVARRLGTAANLLLAAFVESHGRVLSSAVRRSVASTNWRQATEPRSPRPVCDLLLERLGRAEAEVGRLVEASGRGAPGAEVGRGGDRHRRTGSAVEGLESGAVERGMAKLFREKVKVFGEVRMTQSALLGAMASSGLKSLVEGVRLQTLGRAGLQQLQLDMFYLRPALMRLVGPGTAAAEGLGQLLDEVVAAAAERSMEPVLLEGATMERLLAAAAQDQN